MSRVVGWIAIQGMSEQDVAEALGLVAAPDAPKARATICTLPNGWRVLFTIDFDFPTPARMALLSAAGAAIAVSADERTMFSVVRGYERGKAVFAIEHDGGTHGARHIATAGTIPAAWNPILAEANRQQAEEDAGDAMADFVFDAPAALAETLCGYRDDGPWPDGQEPRFTPLMEKKKPGLLERLFGRG
jgi:hypothetical protein